MKHAYRLLLASLLLAAFVSTATTYAQVSDYSYRGALSRLGIGLGASFGFAVPIGDLDDSTFQGGRTIDEAAPGICFRAGLNVSYPFTRTVRGTLATGLDIRNIGKKLSEDTATGTGTELDARSYNVQYFYIEPGFSISAFRLALNIGIPMSGSQPIPPPLGKPGESMDIVSDNLEMMLEPRIGATLILIDEENGWLGLTVDGGFTLNTLFKETTSTPGGYVKGDIPSTNMLNGSLGLTYQFGIPGTGGW